MASHSIIPFRPAFRQFWALDVPHSPHGWVDNHHVIQTHLAYFERNQQLHSHLLRTQKNYAPGHDLVVFEVQPRELSRTQANTLMEQVAQKHPVAFYAHNDQPVSLEKFIRQIKKAFKAEISAEAQRTQGASLTTRGPLLQVWA